MSDNNTPAAGRFDTTEAIIAATIAGMNARPAAPAQAAEPVASQAPVASAAAPQPAPAAAADDTARIFAILECDEAKERPALAKTLAKNAKLSVDEAKALLAVAAVETPATAATGLTNALAERMKQNGNAAGVKPDGSGAADKPSLAQKFQKKFNPQKGA